MSDNLTELTPNLWITQSKYFATNSGIFLDSGHAVLLDPCMLPVEIETIAGFLTRENVVAQTLILTHSHWDHILGPERFPDAKIVAHQEYLAEVSGANGDRILRQIEEWETEAGITRPADQPFRIPMPDELVAASKKLKVGEHVTLTMAHAPGHASDQMVVYDPQTATLWASDILSDLEMPFVSHNLEAFEQTLAMLSKWEVRLLIPGHGHPTDSISKIRRRFVEDRTYLSALRQAVTRAIERGETVVEAVARCSEIPYRHQDANKGAHRLNVESIYLELGGAADPAKVGWTKLVSD
jgi:glyoxylase-like metal-dependent hydrolase (beta-lactamase superfamily II)